MWRIQTCVWLWLAALSSAALIACDDAPVPRRSIKVCDAIADVAGHAAVAPDDGTTSLREAQPAGRTTAKCRAAMQGDVVVNEVLSRPSGRDLDGDGLSTSNDEAIEIVSVANEPVHLRGVKLVFRGEERGTVVSPQCVSPFWAALLVGAGSRPFKPVKGAVVTRLDKTLRLTDSGGALALQGEDGYTLDEVAVPLARNVTEGCVARSFDGDATGQLVPHAYIEHAGGRTWSPGTCADGLMFPGCVREGIVNRARHGPTRSP